MSKKKNKYGFSDEELWALDETIVKFLLPRLKRFKELNNAHPSEYTWAFWNKILDNIIYGLELSAKNAGKLLTYKREVHIRNKLKISMMLIAENIDHLWW